jgi:hypothetical protein
MKKIIEKFFISTKNNVKEFDTTQYKMTKVIKNNNSKNDVDYSLVNDYKHFEFLKTFGVLNSKTTYTPLTEEILDVIEFVEVLKAFAGNKLNTKKQYNLSFFTAKIKNCEESNSPVLSIKLSNDTFITYDKTEAQILSAKLSKVVAKCEVI